MEDELEDYEDMVEDFQTNAEYEVEKIVDMKTKVKMKIPLYNFRKFLFDFQLVISKTIKGNKKEYLVKWKNFAEQFNNWEPEENLKCAALLKEFKEALIGGEKEEKKEEKKKRKRKLSVEKSPKTEKKKRGRPKKGERKSSRSPSPAKSRSRSQSPSKEAIRFNPTTDKVLARISYKKKDGKGVWLLTDEEGEDAKWHSFSSFSSFCNQLKTLKEK